MRSLLAILLALALLAPESAAAQSAAVASVVSDSTPAAAAPAAKKKGMFGKVKGLAKNKIVKTVAKAALCTVVPGGQVVAGALEAAETKNVAGAATTAVTGGSSCMPGMAGISAGADGTGAGLPGQPSTGMPGIAMSPDQLKQMQAQMAAMQGNGNPQLMAAMQARMAQMAAAGDGMPPGMAMSPEQLKQMQAQVGAGGDGMPPGAMPIPPGGLDMAGGAMVPSGAGGGKALDISSDLPGDLKKGKTVIRNIDWIPGGGTVSPGSADDFARAMARVAAAMKQAGGSYRLDLYMDKQSGNVVVRTLGPQRLAAVQASLVEGGATAGADGPQIGDSKKDGDPRLEIVRLK